MQFFATLAIASLAIAAPTSPIKERQDVTVTGSLLTIAQSFQATVLDSAKIIQNSGAAVTAQAGAAAEAAQQLISDNVAKIAAAATASAGLFQGEVGKLSVTTSSEVEKLSVEQRRQLAAALVAAQTAVEGIRPIYDIKITDFTPTLQKAVQDEVDLVRNSIGPLVTPISVLASTITNNLPQVDFALEGVDTALAGLRTVLQNQIAFIGLDLSKVFPGAPTVAVPSAGLPSVSAPGAPALAIPTPSLGLANLKVPSLSVPSVPRATPSVPAIALPGRPN